MTATPDHYERKLSAEEAREGYVLVEKNRLKFFPPVGQPFELLAEATRTAARVEARDCECRGPEKPHQHYFIRSGGLAAGQRVVLTREGSAYRLSLA